ncbi:3'(2'),5'-bisphosphate nucleotidase CysQ [Nitrospirota bacterium]
MIFDQLPELLPHISDIARSAGHAIMEVYESGDFDVTYKDDDSPLTLADKLSHEIIAAGLAQLTPDIPIISEEGSSIPYEERKNWDTFYLVDPLDGTKEFVKRNGEFTVNIALIDRGRPALGVIYVPVGDVLYSAAEEQGAYKTERENAPVKMDTSGLTASNELTIVASRSHGSDALEAYLKGLDVGEIVSAGSSLKFCLVAEGKADLYPRFGPTWEWDTAAGHAIVLEAGGRVISTDGNDELEYNKEILKHKGFIVGSAVMIESL